MDKISIITATYNCVEEIEMSIKSVLEQDYPNIEFIIIDGASTDGTVDIIKKYADRISYWISEPDKGLYYAMNKGIEKASGEWIYIHNAGGRFASNDTLSKIMSVDHSEYPAFYGYVYDHNLKEKCRNPIPFYLQKKKNKRPGYSHQSLFVRSNLCKKYPFDTKFRCCADFNQAITIYQDRGAFEYVDLPICIQAEAGFSAKNRRIQFIENAKINQLYNTFGFKMALLFFDLKLFLKKKLKNR